MSKTIKITNALAVTAFMLLEDPAVAATLEQLLVRDKVRLRKAFLAVGDAAKAFDAERLVLVLTYAEKDEEGVPVIGENGAAVITDMQAFTDALTELLGKESEVAIPVVDGGKLSDLALPFAFINAYENIILF